MCKQMININLFALDDNIPIHKNVTEKKKLAWFWFFAAHLGQHALTDNDSTRYGQWLPHTPHTIKQLKPVIIPIYIYICRQISYN